MEQDVSPNPEEAGTRDGWGRPVAWALAVVLMAVAIAKSRPEEEGAEVAPRTPESPPVVSVAPPPALDSEQHRIPQLLPADPPVATPEVATLETPDPMSEKTKAVTGRWVLNESIKRDVTLRPDGTGTMDVKLPFFASLLYGAEMTLQLKWNVEKELMTYTIVSGTPKANVKRLINDFGDSRTYKILSQNEEILELQDFDEAKTVYRWKRAEG